MRACSVAVKVEAISIDIFHGELTQTPGFLLERLNDSGAQRAQFLVGGVDFRRKYPVNGGFEWTRPSAQEDRDVVTRDGTDISSWVEPTDLEAECIAVMLLCPLHVLNWELRRGMSERRPQFLLVHGNLSSGVLNPASTCCRRRQPALVREGGAGPSTS